MADGAASEGKAEKVRQWIEQKCKEIEDANFKLTVGRSRAKVQDHVRETLKTLKSDFKRTLLEGAAWKGNAASLDMRKFMLKLLDEAEGVRRGHLASMGKISKEEIEISGMKAAVAGDFDGM
eukprot:10589082-Alexandrium_andersonii.AAC.1